MVGLWGMSDELGPVSYGVGETQPFLGREMAAPREFAEETAARIDVAVRSLLEGAPEQARALLSRERAALDALAEELVAKESVNAQRLDEILTAAGAVLPPPAVPLVAPTPVVVAPEGPRPEEPRVAATRETRERR
jgi:cell division protease FtsH